MCQGVALTLFEKQGLAILSLLLPSHPIGAADGVDSLAMLDIPCAIQAPKESLRETADTPVNAKSEFLGRSIELGRENDLVTAKK